jgi:hypothetical protein
MSKTLASFTPAAAQLPYPESGPGAGRDAPPGGTDSHVPAIAAGVNQATQPPEGGRREPPAQMVRF